MDSRKAEMRRFKQSYRIVVVGAGLVGLVVAALLQKSGFQTIVLERDEELQTVGAGIQMPANMNRILKELGVLDEVLSDAVVPPAYLFYSWKGAQLLKMDLNPYMKRNYGVELLTCHRADLRRILFNHAQNEGVDIRMGMKIDKSESDLPQGVIRFHNAAQLNADLIIGADGENSMCREALLGAAYPPRPSGRVANRILINIARLQQDPVLKDLVDQPNVHVWLGPDCQVVCYSLKGDFNIVMNHAATDEEVKPGPQPASKESVRNLLGGWEPRLSRLLDYAHEFSKWMLFETEQTKTWVHQGGKLVLVGDAAHATSPHLAQGAAMGMESAAVLAGLVETATEENQIPELLRRYNAMREPRTSHIIKSSKRQGEIFYMPDGPLQVERDRLMVENERAAGFPFMLADPVLQEWLWSYDARVKVTKMLDSPKPYVIENGRQATRLEL